MRIHTGFHLFMECVQILHNKYVSDFVKMWPLGFCLASGTAQLQACPVSKKVGGLVPWLVQLDSPGTALTVGGWIRPRGQN